MNQFGRVGEIILGAPGQIGRKYSGLNFSFDIKKTSTPEANPGVLNIYGLAEDTRRSIHELETVCIIKAGYSELDGPIEFFRGYVSNCSSVLEGPTWKTTLEIHDGYQELRSSQFSGSYAAGTSMKQMVKDVLKTLKLPESLQARLSDVVDKRLPGTWAFEGQAKDAANDLAKALGIEWSIQSGQVKVLAAGSTDNATAILLTPESGLVGSPERISEITLEKVGNGADKKQSGYRLVSVLLPTVEPGNKISVRSSAVSGTFKIVNVAHAGEIMGATMQTTLEVVDL